MIVALLLAYLVAFGWVARKKFKLNREFDLLPSFAWLVMMILPFSFQYSFLNPQFLKIQSFGIYSLGYALLLGDFYSQNSKKSTKEFKVPTQLLLKIGYGLLAISLIIEIYHIAKMPQIPLFQKWFVLKGPYNDTVLSEMRENALRNIFVSPLFTYVASVCVGVFGPIIIAIFTHSKKYIVAVSYFIILLVYSRIITAKAPIYLVLLLCSPILLFQINILKRRLLLITVATLGGIFIIFGIFYLATNSAGILKYRAPNSQWFEPDTLVQLDENQKSTFTLADHYRRMTELDLKLYLDSGSLLQNLDLIAYRIFIAPSEVAHWWYAYFPQASGGFIGFSGLKYSDRSNSEFIHPATRVGRYAFQQRHPKQYLSAIHAYGAADADAYSRWGITGIILISILVFLFRAAVEYFRVPGFWGDFLSFCICALLAYTLPIGSFFAALVAQGILVYFILEVALWLLNRQKVRIR